MLQDKIALYWLCLQRLREEFSFDRGFNILYLVFYNTFLFPLFSTHNLPHSWLAAEGGNKG